MKRTIYSYKNNFQFQYEDFGPILYWYTEQGEYIGQSENNTYSAQALLDNYIKEMRGL